MPNHDDFFLTTSDRTISLCRGLETALEYNKTRSRELSSVPLDYQPVVPTIPFQSLPKPLRDEIDRLSTSRRVHPVIALLVAMDIPKDLTSVQTVAIDGIPERIESPDIAAIVTLLANGDIGLEESIFMLYCSVWRIAVLIHVLEGARTDGIDPATISRIMQVLGFLLDLLRFVDGRGVLKADPTTSPRSLPSPSPSLNLPSKYMDPFWT